jgi:hypothetical protein
MPRSSNAGQPQTTQRPTLHVFLGPEGKNPSDVRPRENSSHRINPSNNDNVQAITAFHGDSAIPSTTTHAFILRSPSTLTLSQVQGPAAWDNWTKMEQPFVMGDRSNHIFIGEFPRQDADKTQTNSVPNAPFRRLIPCLPLQ